MKEIRTEKDVDDLFEDDKWLASLESLWKLGIKFACVGDEFLVDLDHLQDIINNHSDHPIYKSLLEHFTKKNPNKFGE